MGRRLVTWLAPAPTTAPSSRWARTASLCSPRPRTPDGPGLCARGRPSCRVPTALVCRARALRLAPWWPPRPCSPARAVPSSHGTRDGLGRLLRYPTSPSRCSASPMPGVYRRGRGVPTTAWTTASSGRLPAGSARLRSGPALFRAVALRPVWPCRRRPPRRAGLGRPRLGQRGPVLVDSQGRGAADRQGFYGLGLPDRLGMLDGGRYPGPPWRYRATPHGHWGRFVLDEQ